MPMEDASALTEPSLMELNALSELLIDAFLFQIPTGTELIVFASQDSQLTETHASVTVSSLEITVKDALQNPTQSGQTVSADATTDSLM